STNRPPEGKADQRRNRKGNGEVSGLAVGVDQRHRERRDERRAEQHEQHAERSNCDAELQSGPSGLVTARSVAPEGRDAAVFYPASFTNDRTSTMLEPSALHEPCAFGVPTQGKPERTAPC